MQFILGSFAPKALPQNLSLERIQIPANLDVRATLSKTGTLQKISGNITADTGHVILPEFYPTALPLQNLQITGQYDVQNGNWQISKLGVNILDNDGTIPVTLTADGNTSLRTVHVETALKDMNAAQINRWWPTGAAPGAIAWIHDNLKGGKIPNASFAADLHAAEGQDYALARLSGKWDMQNMTATFLPTFPAVTGINGDAQMDADNIHFNVQSGHLDDVNLQPGTMDISGLQADTQILKMDMPVTAQLPTVLKLLDTKPYEYVKKIGLDASTVSGGVGVDLKMELPLLAALKLSDIKYSAIANVAQVAIPNMLMGKDITQGRGVFELAADHMKITVQADLAGVPGEFTWQDFVAPQDHVTRRVIFNSELVEGDHARLGLPTAGRVTGNTKLSGVYELRDGQGSLKATMDFKDALVHVDDLSFQKPVAKPLTLNVDATLSNGGVLKLDAKGDGVTLQGTGLLDANTNPTQLNFPVFKMGPKNDFQLGFEQRGPQERWTLTGTTLDIGGMLAGKPAAPPVNTTPTPAPTPVPVTTENKSPQWIHLNVGTLYLANAQSMQNVQTEMDYNGKYWDKVMFRGNLRANAPVDVSWDAGTPGRKLLAHSPDAGATLAGLGITDAMIGGDLLVNGAGNPPGSEFVATSKVLIRNFRMREVPLLGRIIAAVSPTELLNKLRGKDGVAFDRLEAGVEYNDALLRIRDGKIHGESLGLTFEGDVNQTTRPETLLLKGTIVPLYAVNNALSGIPLLGSILSGKDGTGLIGFNFKASGTADNPDVSVNPLSAFAPGFLRDLFFDNSAVPPK